MDFEKAFGRVSWALLAKIFSFKCFGERWRKWIRGCSSSTMFLVIVKEEPKDWFERHRGLRQRDPLSPFLFTLLADVRSLLISRRVETSQLKGVKVGIEKVVISHLQYANDTILFLEDDENGLVNILSLLHIFQRISSFRVNL